MQAGIARTFESAYVIPHLLGIGSSTDLSSFVAFFIYLLIFNTKWSDVKQHPRWGMGWVWCPSLAYPVVVRDGCHAAYPSTGYHKGWLSHYTAGLCVQKIVHRHLKTGSKFFTTVMCTSSCTILHSICDTSPHAQWLLTSTGLGWPLDGDTDAGLGWPLEGDTGSLG